MLLAGIHTCFLNPRLDPVVAFPMGHIIKKGSICIKVLRIFGSIHNKRLPLSLNSLVIQKFFGYFKRLDEI